MTPDDESTGQNLKPPESQAHTLFIAAIRDAAAHVSLFKTFPAGDDREELLTQALEALDQTKAVYIDSVLLSISSGSQRCSFCVQPSQIPAPFIFCFQDQLFRAHFIC